MTGIDTPPAFDEWCIVELLGHRRLAARVRETTIAGVGMLRLDEPHTESHDARTQYVSPSSVYALHPTTERVVTALAARWAADPVSLWELGPVGQVKQRLAEVEALETSWATDPDEEENGRG